MKYSFMAPYTVEWTLNLNILFQYGFCINIIPLLAQCCLYNQKITVFLLCCVLYIFFQALVSNTSHTFSAC